MVHFAKVSETIRYYLEEFIWYQKQKILMN